MRNCIYCGMPMEDDDLICTRCGKEVSRQSAEGTKGAEKAAGTPEKRPDQDSGRKVRRGMMYGNPQKNDLDEDYEGGRKLDSVTVMLLAAAAVLLVVLGSLLFRIVNTSRRGNESLAQNEIAVYDDKDRAGEQNLNQGMQTPSAGQAEDQEEQSADIQEQISYPDPQPADPQTYAAPAQEQESAQEAEEAEEPEEDFDEDDYDEEDYSEEEIEEEEPEKEDFDEAEYVEEEPGEEDFDEEEPGEEDFDEEDYAEEEFEEENEDDEYGWVTDEDGNEVYYFREGEEFDFDDQTGSVGIQASSAPEAARTDAQQGSAGQSEPAPAAGALAGSSAPGSSDYILSESNSRYYTAEELRGLDDNTLQMAINEIYARHGRRFSTGSMQEYFDGKDWYSGTIDPAEFDGNEALYFNEYEVGNRELMSRIRAERQQASAAAGQ